MEKELERIILSIKNKTGIDINVLSLNGIFSVSTKGEYESIILNDDLKELNGFYQKNGKTYFSFEFGGVKFIGELNGDDKISLNYSKFIVDVIESSVIVDGESNYQSGITAILKGEFSKNKITRFMQKYSVKESPLYVVYFTTQEDRKEELKDFLNNYSVGGVDIGLINDNKVIFVKFIENKEYISIKEYINVLINAIYEETGINVYANIGGKAETFLEMNSSYKQAIDTEYISKIFNNTSKIREYKDYILYKVFEDLSIQKLMEYKKQLGYDDLKLDKTLEETANKFLKNNLNVSETARDLYVHRNTLMYRLDKIKEISKLDLRNYNDANIYTLINILLKIEK